jgi:hypothetical protein
MERPEKIGPPPYPKKSNCGMTPAAGRLCGKPPTDRYCVVAVTSELSAVNLGVFIYSSKAQSQSMTSFVTPVQKFGASSGSEDHRGKHQTSICRCPRVLKMLWGSGEAARTKRILAQGHGVLSNSVRRLVPLWLAPQRGDSLAEVVMADDVPIALHCWPLAIATGAGASQNTTCLSETTIQVSIA